MKELINELRKENQTILTKKPKLAMEFDWSGDAYKLQHNEETINKLENLFISVVGQQRKLLIDLLTKLENGGGSAFIDKEQIVDDYLKAN